MATSDYWIVKTDAAGNIQWQNTIGGIDNDGGPMDIHQTVDGGYIVGGNSYSNISGDKTENSLGSLDYWIVKTDVSGNIQWQNTIGGDTSDVFSSLQQTADGGYILAGYSRSEISGDKTENNWDSTLTTSDYWIVKLSPDVGINEDKKETNSLSIYPNPATNELAVSCGLQVVKDLEIYDVLGEIVFSQRPTASSQKLSVNVSDLSPGIYFVKVKTEQGISMAKFVKE